jgi:hypothetical protein
MLDMPVLITIFKLVEIEGLVEIDAILEVIKCLCLMSFVVGFAMSLTISAKGITQTVDLFLESLHVAFTKSHTSIATNLITQESDIAIAIFGVIAIIPKEEAMGLDVPELLAGAIGHALEGMVIESMGLK